MNKTLDNILKLLPSFEKNKVHNIRENGKTVSRNSNNNVSIETNSDNNGINVIVKEGSIGEIIHIPVVVTNENLNDIVNNTFTIGDNSFVTIYAGCIVHNNCEHSSSHKGIHTFNIGKNSKVKYIENHYGIGNNKDKNIDTKTIINQEENSVFIMNTTQNKGVNNANRETIAILNKNSIIEVKEKLITHEKDKAYSSYDIQLNGLNSVANIVSKSVASNNSFQHFVSNMNGNNEVTGHVECDAILMDDAKVISTPSVIANSSKANLTHEAAIGKIAKNEIIKLMTLGKTEKEAEEIIIKGFIK